MSESASEDITELSNEDSELSRTDTLDASDDGDDEPRAGAAREGLPRSFRMRHDAHYVDELMSRSPDASSLDPDARSRRLPEPRPRPVEDAPAPVAQATAAGRSIAAVAARLESVVAHADVIGTPVQAFSAVATSVRVELVRVARLARAAAVLHDRELPLRRLLSARDVADAAGAASTPVARFAGLDCEVTVDDPAFTILADPDLVQLAIAGTVDAIVDVLASDRRRARVPDGRDGVPRVTIALQSVKVRPALIIDVICPTLGLTEAEADRLFDADAGDSRAAASPAILLPAAARIVRAHGGRADVKRHNGIGATVTYVFPQSAPEQ